MKRRFSLTTLLGLVITLIGCDGDPPMRTVGLDRMPDPVTPIAAVNAFEWTWDHQDSTAHEALLSDAFRFQFALGDSAANAFAGRAMSRDEFACAVNRLFDASRASGPTATRMTLDWLQPLRDIPDSRPGRNPEWHRELPTAYRFDAATDSGNFTLTGVIRFFVVRGDSAGLPGGSTYDPNHWFVDEIHDETEVDPVLRVRPADTHPAQNQTLGMLFSRFRCP